MLNFSTIGGQGYAPLRQYLDTVGDGTGTINANGSYTPGSPGIFKIVPAAGQKFLIGRMVIGIFCASGSNNLDNYGGIAKLTNGIKVELYKGITPLSLVGQTLIKSMDDWARVGATPQTTWFEDQDLASQSPPFTFTYELDFTKEQPLILGAGNYDLLQVTCQDAFTAPIFPEHTFFVAGIRM